jgi:hypothetical protein
MAVPFIPTPDGLALTMMEDFAEGISADPGTYQCSAADALAITAAVNAYALAYQAATNPATRTPLAITSKDQNRASAEQIVRQFAGLIRANAGISDAAKEAIGVRPVNNTRSPINVPSSSPLIGVIGATPGSHTLRYADSTAPDRMAKPFGAAAIQIFRAVGTEPTTLESAASFYGVFTKNPVGVAFGETDDGKVATYFARWQSRRGDVGPWSLPVSMRIAA